MSLPPDDKWDDSVYQSNVPVRMWENNESEDYPLHWHTATEIIMPVKNGYTVTVRDVRYQLRENDILIVPSRELHSIRVPPDAVDGKRFILMFEPLILYSVFGHYGIVSELNSTAHITPKTMPAIHRKIHALLTDSCDEMMSSDGIKFTATYNHIIEMYLLLMRYYTDSQKKSGNDKQITTRQENISRLDAIFKYMDKYPEQNLTLKKAAEIANFSPVHLERIFKTYTNMSFYQFLRQRMIGKAEKLLQNPKLSIIDVVKSSGFTSVTTFNRVFRQIRNCTPSEYKKMYQIGM